MKRNTMRSNNSSTLRADDFQLLKAEKSWFDKNNWVMRHSRRECLFWIFFVCTYAAYLTELFQLTPRNQGNKNEIRNGKMGKKKFSHKLNEFS